MIAIWLSLPSPRSTAAPAPRMTRETVGARAAPFAPPPADPRDPALIPPAGVFLLCFRRQQAAIHQIHAALAQLAPLMEAAGLTQQQRRQTRGRK